MASRGEYEFLVKISGDLAASFGASFQKAEREITALYNASSRKSAGMVRGIDNLAGISDKAFSGMLKGAEVAAAGTLAIGTASAKAGADFESQMSTVQAISGANAAEMRDLKAVAEEMGRTTSFSAAEAGQGLEYMAMAGWKTQDMVSGLPGIMNLAAASGEDLGLTSDIVTDALTAFGLAAKDSAMFADVLAAASSNSNTNVAMMGDTFQYVAPVAGSFGYDVKDVAVGIGLMANAGIKGQKAGTALRTTLTNLAKPTKQIQGYMDALSISLTDSEGNVKPFRDQLLSLRDAFAGLSEAERAEYAAGIAGKEGMSGLLAMVNASDADFEKLASAIENSNGAAERMANIRLDNLQGDVTLLASAAEGAGIGIYNGLMDPLREATQLATAWVQSFTESGWLEQFTTEGIPTARRNLIQLAEGFEPILNTGKWFLKNPKVISSGLAGIGSTLLTFKAAQGAVSAVKMLGTLSGMLGAWPVAAAGLAVGSIVGIGTAVKQTEQEAARANLAEHLGSLTLSMEELNEAARNIVGADLLDGIDQFYDASSKTSGLYRSLKDGISDINKSNWKLKLGVEFTEEDVQSYVSSVEQYVKNAQDYITSSGYELKLAVGIVMGDSADGQSMQESNDAFTQALMAQMEPIQKNISDTLQEITESGLSFDELIDKQQLLDQYLTEMSELTQMITDAQNAARLQMIQGNYSGLEVLTPESFQNLQQQINEYTDDAIAGIDQAHEKILTSLNAKRIAGEQGMEGGISPEEFDQQSAAEFAQYYQRKADAIMQGQQAMKDAILNTYGDEIEPALEQVEQAIRNQIQELMKNTDYAMSGDEWASMLDRVFLDTANAAGLSSSTKDALAMLVEGMAPGQEQLAALSQQYLNAGGQAGDEFMKGVAEAMGQVSEMDALAGNADAMWSVIGASIAESPELAVAISASEQNSGMIADAAVEAINRKNGEVAEAAANLLRNAKAEMERIGIDANVPVRVSLNMAQGSMGSMSPSGIGKRAAGGIVTEPELSWIAEGGYPEAIIPMDGSRHAMELWQETGRLIGAYEQNGYRRINEGFSGGGAAVTSAAPAGAAPVPVFAPVNYIYGASGEEVGNAMQMTFEQYKEWYYRLVSEERRVSF